MFEWLRKTDLLESHQLHRQWFPWVHHIDSRAYMSMVLPMISYGLPPPPPHFNVCMFCDLWPLLRVSQASFTCYIWGYHGLLVIIYLSRISLVGRCAIAVDMCHLYFFFYPSAVLSRSACYIAALFGWIDWLYFAFFLNLLFFLSFVWWCA